MLRGLHKLTRIYKVGCHEFEKDAPDKTDVKHRRTSVSFVPRGRKLLLHKSNARTVLVEQMRQQLHVQCHLNVLMQTSRSAALHVDDLNQQGPVLRVNDHLEQIWPNGADMNTVSTTTKPDRCTLLLRNRQFRLVYVHDVIAIPVRRNCSKVVPMQLLQLLQMLVE